MSDVGTAPTKRPRTATRARAVVPPGMTPPRAREDVKTIGRYEILEVIGKGAMGVVYKGRDPLLDRIVAVKTIVAPDRVGRRVRSAFLERFQREAKAAAKMQHPAIVTIFDVGLEDDAPFMVLEYLPGESLADRLDRVRMPLGRAVNIARDLAGALGFAHRERIVHRDVKPANVLHAGEERWKLADFGIARMPDSDLTQAGIFMGTPGYAPPEAIRDGFYSPQADVFAWGAVLYELLCGKIPYEGPDTQTTNGYVLKATAKPPTVHDGSIPAPLAEVVMRALHGDPGFRYKHGAEVEAALSTAWDKCLNDGLVHPSALTAHEASHEQVRGPMHGPPAAPPGATARLPAQPAPAPAPAPVIASAHPVVSEDEPTTVMMRDQVAERRRSDRPVDAPRRAAAPNPPAAGPTRDAALDAAAAGLFAEPRRMVEEPRRMAPKRTDETAAVGHGRAPAVWLWVTIFLIALAGGAVAAFYLLRG
jgi:serine/threonine-protein kinase